MKIIPVKAVSVVLASAMMLSVAAYWRVSGCLLQQGIHPAHPAHPHHRTEGCHCSCISPPWSVLLEAGVRSHSPTLLGPHPGSALNGV